MSKGFFRKIESWPAAEAFIWFASQVFLRHAPSVDKLCLAEALQPEDLVIWLQGSVADLGLGRRELANDVAGLVDRLVLV